MKLKEKMRQTKNIMFVSLYLMDASKWTAIEVAYKKAEYSSECSI